MSKTQAALTVFMVTGPFFALIGLFIWWSIRAQKRRREETLERLRNSLASAGGRDTHTVQIARSALQGRLPINAIEATTGDGLTYRVFTFMRGKYEYAEIQLVTTMTLPLVVFRPETGRDRFGRTMGLNREMQLEDEEFDRHVYVESDEDDEIIRAALNDQRLRSAILDAVKKGRTVTMSKHGVSMIMPLSFATPAQAQIDERLALLKELSVGLRHVDGAVGEWQGARGDKLIVFGVLSFALVYFVAFIAGLAENAGWVPVNKTGQSLPKLIALGAMVVSVLANYLYVRGHSRSLRNFLILLLPGLLVIPFTVPLVLWGANALLDHAPASTTHATLTSKVEKRNGKTMDRHMTFAIGNEQPAPQYIQFKSLTLKVSHAQYRLLPVNGYADLVVHQGAFGWPWVSDIVPVADPAPTPQPAN